MMEATVSKSEHLYAATLGAAAAVSALVLATVAHDGTSASKYALLFLGFVVLVLLSGLAYLRPLVVVVIALTFITCPLQLILSLEQSAFVSMFLLGGAALGIALRVPLKSITPDSLILPIGLLASYAVVSSVYGIWLGNGIGYTLGDCFQIIEFAIVYFLISQLLTKPETTRVALRFWLASVLATVLVELLLFALGPGAGNLLPSWEPTADSDVVLRTIDINAAILFAVLVNLYPVARERKQRFWILLALVPIAVSIALSLSRGLWFCSLVAIVVSMMLQQRAGRRRLLRAFAGVSIVVLLLAATWKTGTDSDSSLLGVFGDRVFYGVDQVEQGFAGTESMETRRFLEWIIVGPQVVERPLMGRGLGATYVIPGFAVIDQDTSAPIDHHFIHNLYLVTAFRMGTIGLTLLLWIFVRYFRKIVGLYRRMDAGWDRALAAGLVAGIVGQLCLSVTQPTVTDHPTCAVIACAMALSIRLATRAPQRPQMIGPGIDMEGMTTR